MKKRILATLLTLAMLASLFPVALATGEEGGEPTEEGKVIYVSKDGMGDGSTADTPKKFDDAMAATDVTDGTVYKIVGEVTVANFVTPKASISIEGNTTESVLAITDSGSMQGDLTLDNITLKIGRKAGYYGTAVNFFANGNALVIEKNITAEYVAGSFGPSSLSIYGGGKDNTITVDTTSVTIKSLWLGSNAPNVYGGGFESTVNGNTNVIIDGGRVGVVFGGGHAIATNSEANVIGNTHIELRNNGYASSGASAIEACVCGGGRVYTLAATAKVQGNTWIEISDCNATSQSRYIYGGGFATASGGNVEVTGNTKIELTNSSVKGLYGGGCAPTGGNATVGSVNITVTNSSCDSGLYGGGSRANVTGNVVIAANNKDSKISAIYAGGAGQSSGGTTVGGTASITLNGPRTTVYTQGNYGTVTGKTTVELKAGGATRGDPYKNFLERIYNYDGSEVNSGKPKPGSVAKKDAELVVTGDFTATEIFGFPTINIQNGGTLREHTRQYTTSQTEPLPDGGITIDWSKPPTENLVHLFNGCKDVTIESGGTLDLIQDNEISGSFTASGELRMLAPDKSPGAKDEALTAAGSVTVHQGASYIATKVQDKTGGLEGEKECVPADYVRGDVFLKSKETYTVDPAEKKAFAVSDAGKEKLFSTEDRVAGAEPIKHEWFVTAPVQIKPVELTKYITNDHQHEAGDFTSNCFPDIRVEGLTEESEIKVGGISWDITKQGYPFQINYYNVPTVYNPENPPENLGAPITEDHTPGTYIARIEAKDGKNLSDITVDGSPVQWLNSYLHIREVSSVGEKGELIKLASQVTEKAPETPEELGREAVAVMPENQGYLVNNIPGQKVNPGEDIRLLHDELLTSNEGTSDIFMNAMQKRLEDDASGSQLVKPDSNRKYAMKYLDLIDANDSNLLVCAQSEYDIYIPYPAGTSESTEFQLFRFDDLNRTYTEADNSNAALDNINSTTITEIEIEKTEAGIKFTVPKEWGTEENYSIGAMALTWIKKSSPPVTTRYTLHYESNGGTEYKDERYKRNTVVELDKVPVREGYRFTGWYADAALTEPVDSVKMTRDRTVYAGWQKSTVPELLNGEDHFAYVVGYEDGTVRPQANISRAEVAAIFFRLLKADIRDGNLTTESGFADVSEAMWSNQAIATMAKLGILQGRTAETFVPNAPITRAEFAAICARFDTGLSQGASNFTDIDGHWAKEEIQKAVSLGWILGYEDNTFRPDANITRAEAVTMINRVLCRIPETEEDLLADMRTWPDNQPGLWYYLAVQEATNSHEYVTKGEIYETWTNLTQDPDWSRYQ